MRKSKKMLLLLLAIANITGCGDVSMVGSYPKLFRERSHMFFGGFF